jgi:hypothetical protein
MQVFINFSRSGEGRQDNVLTALRPAICDGFGTKKALLSASNLFKERLERRAKNLRAPSRSVRVKV